MGALLWRPVRHSILRSIRALLFSEKSAGIAATGIRSFRWIGFRVHAFVDGHETIVRGCAEVQQNARLTEHPATVRVGSDFPVDRLLSGTQS